MLLFFLLTARRRIIFSNARDKKKKKKKAEGPSHTVGGAEQSNSSEMDTAVGQWGSSDKLIKHSYVYRHKKKKKKEKKKHGKRYFMDEQSGSVGS